MVPTLKVFMVYWGKIHNVLKMKNENLDENRRGALLPSWKVMKMFLEVL